MDARKCLSLCLLITLTITTACAAVTTPGSPDANLPNPASVHCEEQGGIIEMRQDEAGNIFGVCLFSDGSECDEWAYFRGECQQGEVFPAEDNEPDPMTPSDPQPAVDDSRQGWWTYTHTEYGFEISLPQDWVIEETTAAEPLMNDHLLELHPSLLAEGDLHIRMTFRRIGEDTLLWPTGVGAGDLKPEGALEIAGAPARRVLFVCPTGQVNSIYYQGEDEPNIRRGEMEFAFILSFSGVYCQEGYSLEGKRMHVAEQIISSLKVVPDVG